MKRHHLVLLSLFFFQFSAAQESRSDDDIILILLSTLHDNPEVRKTATTYLSEAWSDTYVAPIVDLIYMAPAKPMQRELYALLESKIDKKIERHPFKWWKDLWSQPANYPSFYSKFKGRLYSGIDNRFQRYFYGSNRENTIRLDEIIRGGVEQDGIPPLSDPELLESHQDDYLSKNDIVFGVVINGIAKAYPKRILAWHEMIKDNFGDIRMTGVYCTLCGTMIAYDSKIGERTFEFGTSGFLYRSNKLMYDKQTQSLWNTIEGHPVVGTILNDSLTLRAYPVVTTTWKEWKKRYPKTKVLSINTGHVRDYGTGVAYKEYFAVDDLMFPVPKSDERLDNKEEIIVLKTQSMSLDPLAITKSFLKKNRVYHFEVNHEKYIALTDRKGGVYVFESSDYTFEHWIDKGVVDSNNELWNFNSEFLFYSKDNIKLNRVPTHSIFWFAWFNTHPETRLIH